MAARSTPARRTHPLTLLALCLPLHGAFAAAPPSPQRLTLDFLPLPATQTHLVMHMKATINVQLDAAPDASDEQRERLKSHSAAMKMPMAMDMGVSLDQKTSPKNRKGEFRLTADVAPTGMTLTDSTGATMPVPASRAGFKFSAVLRKGHFADIAVQGSATPAMSDAAKSAMFKQLIDNFGAIQGKTLAIGDTVEVPLELPVPLPMPLPGANQMKMSVAYTLRGIEHGVASFDTAMHMSGDLALPAVKPATAASDAPSAASAPDAAAAQAASAAPQAMHIEGGGTGHLLYRLRDHLPLRHDFELKMSMKQLLPDGAAMNTQMDMTMLMTQERPSAKVRR